MFYLLDLGLALGILGLGLFIFVFSSFAKVFLVKIDLVNCVALGSLSGSLLYCCNRHFNNMPFEFQIHTALCVVAGIVICVLSYFIQKTTVGFWIFTIIFSVLWSALLTIIVTLFTKDMIWLCTIFGISMIINISSHLRARQLKIDLANSI